MKKRVIENDIKKMKSLISYDLGQTIREQEEKYGNCGGSNKISPPKISQLQILYNKKTQKPSSVRFTFAAYFGAAKTEDVYTQALGLVKKGIMTKLENKNLAGLYDMNLVDISQVIGSASNYLSGPLQPTYNNNNEPINPQLLTQPPFDTLPKKGDYNWDKNLGYAESRWKGLVNTINQKGKELGFSVKDGIQPKKITAKITDTGGCTDEKRDSSKYPNPGQYVIVRGGIKLSLRPLGDVEKEEIFNCAKGIRIVVGYFRKGGASTSIGDGSPKIRANSSIHKCNYATFTIKCNKEVVGISNMNNGDSFDKIPKAMKGISQNADNPDLINRKAPNDAGDTVYSVFAVQDKKLKEIISKSTDGLLTLGMEGTPNTLLRRGKYHGDAPMVFIYIANTDGQYERTIYPANEPFAKAKTSRENDVAGTYKPLVTFDPCKKLTT